LGSIMLTHSIMGHGVGGREGLDRVLAQDEVLKQCAARKGSVTQAAVISRMGDRLRLFMKDSGFQLNRSPEGPAEVGDVIDVLIASVDPRRGKLVVRRA
jgi:hypothetical protein